mgnify:CR=1 FL=1
MVQTVLVTGVSGYIGLHVAQQLLDAGYAVRGSVRNQAKALEVQKTLADAKANTDLLSCCQLDLLKDDHWDEAVKGCDYVMHVASPYVIANPKHEDELIGPAVDGTLRVLKAAKKAGVKRVVLTSSIVAMMGGMTEGTFGPTRWTDPESPAINTYTKSKTLAEKAAWDFVNNQTKDTVMDMVSVNPGGVFGPPLGRVITGQSMAMIAKMLGGKLPLLPSISIPMVDVRDVAALHLLAMTAEGVVGKRLIAAQSKATAFVEIAHILKAAGYKKPSTLIAPNWLFRLATLFDAEARGSLGMLDAHLDADTSETVALLDFQPRSLKDSLIDTALVVKTLI